MPNSTSTPKIDVREILPRERHPLIFETFRGLAPAQAMEIVNDHDPKPLYYQMQAEQPDQFSWDYLASGPEVWQVRITKRSSDHGGDQCCGACGGN